MVDLGQVSRNASWTTSDTSHWLRPTSPGPMAIWEPLAQTHQSLICHNELAAHRQRWKPSGLAEAPRLITVSHAWVLWWLVCPSLHGIGLMRKGPLNLQIDALVGRGHPYPLAGVTLAASRPMSLQPIRHMYATGQEGSADKRRTLPHKSLH
jgi:hypothetical protein